MADNQLRDVRYVVYSDRNCPLVAAIKNRLTHEACSKEFYFQDVRDLRSRPNWLTDLPTIVDTQKSVYCDKIECLFFVENVASNQQVSFAAVEDEPGGDVGVGRLKENALLERIRTRFGQ